MYIFLNVKLDYKIQKRERERERGVGAFRLKWPRKNCWIFVYHLPPRVAKKILGKKSEENSLLEYFLCQVQSQGMISGL